MSKYNFPIMLLAVRDYGMDEVEEAAFRMLVDYIELKLRYFPGYMLENVSTTKDPRKSHYFRVCHKVIRETSALLPKECRRLYVKAQLQILKMIEGDGIPITVECLAGPKAWKRWLVWWSRYQKQRNVASGQKMEITSEVLERARLEVAASAEFLKKRKITDLRAALGRGDLNRWVKTGVVSPYYLATLADGEQLAQALGIDLSDYRAGVAAP